MQTIQTDRNLESLFFKGVSLGGGKTDKTAVAQIEFFNEEKKLFLHSIKKKIKTQNEYSSDQQLIEFLQRFQERTPFVAVNVPLGMPVCVPCKLDCPGFETCEVEQIQYLWKLHRASRSKKLFTPYTERCAEVYLANQLEEKFYVPHALGANKAPVAARAIYIKRLVPIPFIEVDPKISLWRIGRSLGIQKSYLRFHKHSIDGNEVREAIIDHLVQNDVVFIYEEDRAILSKDISSFDAFICALTAVLKHQKQVEGPPKDFPSGESWIEIPNKTISWS